MMRRLLYLALPEAELQTLRFVDFQPAALGHQARLAEWLLNILIILMMPAAQGFKF